MMVALHQNSFQSHCCSDRVLIHTCEVVPGTVDADIERSSGLVFDNFFCRICLRDITGLDGWILECGSWKRGWQHSGFDLRSKSSRGRHKGSSGGHKGDCGSTGRNSLSLGRLTGDYLHSSGMCGKQTKNICLWRGLLNCWSRRLALLHNVATQSQQRMIIGSRKKPIQRTKESRCAVRSFLSRKET